MLTKWKPCQWPFVSAEFQKRSYVRLNLKLSSGTSRLLDDYEESNTEKISVDQVR
jgi:hypothetical protein